MDITKVKCVYFLGIGGIGMSALAHYFLHNGCAVYGYDLTPSDVTDTLAQQGVVIHFEEDITQIPPQVDLVIHTPAVSTQHAEYQYFVTHRIPIYKRAQLLGLISKTKPTIAVAGTHGKTSTTALISHILHPEKSIMAFIGGIAKNLNSNFTVNDCYEMIVAEADEYDRSFLSLHPSTAIITSMDADHLDIYGGKESLEESFQLFANQIAKEGHLIIHEKIASQIKHPHKITYSFSESADYYASDIRLYPNRTIFTLHGQGETIPDIELSVPGAYNLLNALAAIAAVRVAYQGRGEAIDLAWLTSKLSSFSGVKRRFDYQLYRDDIVYIDDYAHHPEEIRSFLQAVKAIFPDKKITAIFQPHLYSRTRDFANEFATTLAIADEVILLDIYPARELPIEGVTSNWLLSLIDKEEKIALTKEALLPYLQEHKPEILVTIGAGDIDRLVPKIRDIFN